MFKSTYVAIVAFVLSAAAAPAPSGITFDSKGWPLLNLPYATYRAASYDRSDDYYSFTNIRFAAPPVGPLRWQKPQPPPKLSGIQDGKEGYQCLQALPGVLAVGTPFLEAIEPKSEDCLFLDVLVPGKLIRGEAKNLPVLNWIFGGGYGIGSKSFLLYDGHALLNSAKNNMIYVAGNYRLGAFGWLAGPSVKAGGGVQNVALFDQRAVLQWIQDYIGLLGGDKTQVTAMGESAGAGSLMHHLVAKDGTQDPLFKRAILQSPAFLPQYSRGMLDTQFYQFAKAAGCLNQGLDCLRTKSTAVLDAANKEVVEASDYGKFGFGPAVDHEYITDLPGALIKAGKFWKGVSIITGHTAEEGILFSNPLLTANSDIEGFINVNFPNTTTTVRNQITNTYYPAPGFLRPYSNNFKRLNGMIGDFIVNCNVRWLSQAYQGNSYAYNFAVPPGIHGIDLLFTFWRTDLNIGQFQLDFDIPGFSSANLPTLWQSYITSFVRSGNPNTYRQIFGFPFSEVWPKATTSKYTRGLDFDITNVRVKDDEDTSREHCDFWQGKTWRSLQD